MSHARVFLLAIAVLGLPSPRILSAQDFVGRIVELRLTEGPYAGGFRQQANDARLNWYFANLGLLAVCEGRPDLVEPYLDLYLSKVDGRTGTIRDVADLGTGALQRSDSDDSYAATFLSLAARYRASPGGERWWGRNRAKLKEIARLVLLDHQKPSGLVPSFANSDRGTVAYLMDNCEVYRGLRDLSRALRADRDPDAKTYAEAADRVATGVVGLFDEGRQSFRHADIAGAETFYPQRAAQVFPEVFGVPLGDAARTRARYAAAWAALNAGGAAGQPRDRWEEGEVADGSLGGYPWMVLGYAAVRRGEPGVARTQLASFARRSGRPDPPPSYTAIQELGWAARATSALGGGRASSAHPPS